MVAHYVRSEVPEIKACYQWSLKTDPTLAGKIVMDWTIDADGIPRGVHAESNSMPASKVLDCLRALIENWRFARPPGGSVEVSFPFVFKPEESIEPKAPDASAPVGEKRVIFDKEIAPKIWITVARGEFWTPTPADVTGLEAELLSYLRQKEPAPSDAASDSPLSQRALSYHRQYVGLVKDHRRILWGNFFCDAGNTDWHRKIVMGLGGGDCYFEVKYDVEARRLFDLSINGPM